MQRILSCLFLSVGLSSNAFAQDVVFSPSSLGQFRVTTLVKNLQNPWGMAFLPDGRLLITERSGQLRIYSQGQVSAPITGVPAVYSQGQGGLLDVAIDPNFAQNQRVYLSYAEVDSANASNAGTAVMRAQLNGNRLDNAQVIFRQLPKLSTGNHFGSRLAFDREGYLFVTLGENNNRITAQYLDHHQGKVLRLKSDGSIPSDNPFVGRANAKPEIFSYGHRNPQGGEINPWTGKFWMHEHGPRGGDEINIPESGKNYGWPIITHGIDYNGQPIPESTGTSAPGMEQPMHYWVPSIGPSGMSFYNGNKKSAWFGNLFVGALASQQLVRLELKGNTIVREERLLGELGYRIRDVSTGPDGELYVLTDSSTGNLLKITPPPKPVIRTIKPPPERRD
jgi:aldose sugar dehydrogenase